MKKLLYFTASWCGPCHQMSPNVSMAMDKFSNVYTLEKIDVDTQPDLCTKMNIRGVPTMIILDEQGQEQARKTGAMPYSKFVEWLADYTMVAATVSLSSADYCELKTIKGENKMLTAIKRALGLTQTDEIVGSVNEFAGWRLPINSLPCDGRELPVGNNDYVALFSLIGTKYGGDGQKTFRIPDLRPRDSKGKLVNEKDPWADVPTKIICYRGLYPVMD